MHRLLLAPWVVAMRWPGLMAGLSGPSPRQRRENRRMVDEKIAAAQAGGMAAGRTLATLAFQAAAAGWAPWTLPRLARAQRAVLEAALAPAARTVGANAKRLSRRRGS